MKRRIELLKIKIAMWLMKPAYKTMTEVMEESIKYKYFCPKCGVEIKLFPELDKQEEGK